MNDKLVPIYHNGTPVITTELLAQAYETDTNNHKNNFNNHKNNFNNHKNNFNNHKNNFNNHKDNFNNHKNNFNNHKDNFNNHKDNFKEGAHYYLLKGDDLRAFKREVNDIDLVAPNVNQLYLWTERGANRHCKILDTPKAWEQFDNLEETYFLVKEQRNQKAIRESAAAEKRATAMLLNAKNRTAAFLQSIWRQESACAGRWGNHSAAEYFQRRI